MKIAAFLHTFVTVTDIINLVSNIEKLCVAGTEYWVLPSKIW